jgi:hypothetical protein
VKINQVEYGTLSGRKHIAHSTQDQALSETLSETRKTKRWTATVSETVSENTERVVKNSGELWQIVLDVQRENPYSPRS